MRDSVGQRKTRVPMGGDVDDVHHDPATKKTRRAWGVAHTGRADESRARKL